MLQTYLQNWISTIFHLFRLPLFLLTFSLPFNLLHFPLRQIPCHNFLSSHNLPTHVSFSKKLIHHHISLLPFGLFIFIHVQSANFFINSLFKSALLLQLYFSPLTCSAYNFKLAKESNSALFLSYNFSDSSSINCFFLRTYLLLYQLLYSYSCSHIYNDFTILFLQL